INKFLNNAIRDFELVSNNPDKNPKVETRIQNFKKEFYNLSQLESWSAFMSNFLDIYKDWQPIDLSDQEARLGIVLPWLQWRVAFLDFVRTSQTNPLLEETNWRIVNLETFSSYELALNFPLASYANAKTLGALDRIYRIISVNSKFEADSSEVIESHFGVQLPAIQLTDELSRSAPSFQTTIELTLVLAVWRLYRRGDTGQVEKFIDTIWQRATVLENGHRGISPLGGSTVFLLVLLAALYQDHVMLHLLSPKLLTMEIYTANFRTTRSATVRLKWFVQCLDGWGLPTTAADFLRNSGLPFDRQSMVPDFCILSDYIGCPWLGLSPEGGFGIVVPLNLLESKSDVIQFLPDHLQEIHTSFMPIDDAKLCIYRESHPIIGTIWSTIKQAQMLIQGLRTLATYTH
ncbi:hypothetical protein H4R33_002379, partial [Dimargaris cristalligena]